MKYFLLGAFASAFLLYGVAMSYGAAATTSIQGLARALAGTTGSQPLALVGALLLVVGLGFKVSLVPFHMWTPDVYQGAPSPVTAFMSAATKAAVFVALVRVLDVAFVALQWDLAPAIAALSARLDGGRQRARDRPARREAHARLLERRAGGVHPVGLRRARPRRHRRRAVLPDHLRRRGARRVRRRDADLRRYPRADRVRPVPGPRAQPARARRAADDLPALARGHPPDGRVRREGAGVRGRHDAPATGRSC